MEVTPGDEDVLRQKAEQADEILNDRIRKFEVIFDAGKDKTSKKRCGSR